MPHKHNADRRHHIPKMAFKVQNWPEYEAALRRRDSLTLWIEGAALDHWQTFGPGGQAHCEMNGAIRRRRNRLADQESGQGNVPRGCHEQNPPHCEDSAQVTRVPRSGFVQQVL
jgi:hypothetical protein